MANELERLHHSSPELLGTARWAAAGELNELRYAPGKIWLGYQPGEAAAIVGYNDDRHICLVSGSRGGKGASLIIPNLLDWPGSVVVVDPKGENATVAASRRGQGSQHCLGLGQKVCVLDPFGQAHVDDQYRVGYNPLSALSGEDEEAVDEAARIADALVVQTNKNEPFWDESARSLVRALILFVLTDPRFDGRRNLISVRELIARGDPQLASAMRSAASESDVDIEGLTPHSAVFRVMEISTSFEGVLSGAGSSFRNMAEQAPKTFDGVLQTANRNTEFIDSPGMRRCLTGSGLSLAELKTSGVGVSVFLTLPQRYMSTHHRWLRMMVTLIVTEMEKVRGQPRSGHRVLLILDEFAGLGRMEALENATAQIAGHGIKIMFVVQSFTQLKQLYDHNWELFLSNASIKVFFQIDDAFTREYVSKLIGETELVRETQSVSRSRGESTSHSAGGSSNVTQGTSGSSTSGHSSGLSGRAGFLNFTDNWSSGTNYSSTSGWSRSQSSGSSWSKTTGSSHGETAGINQTILKRPLISPDEIGSVFARQEDASLPDYPGLALILVSGRLPTVVRRVNYFQDAYFANRFDAHPDHPNSAGPKLLSATTTSSMPEPLRNLSSHHQNELRSLAEYIRREAPHLPIAAIPDRELANSLARLAMETLEFRQQTGHPKSLTEVVHALSVISDPLITALNSVFVRGAYQPYRLRLSFGDETPSIDREYHRFIRQKRGEAPAPSSTTFIWNWIRDGAVVVAFSIAMAVAVKSFLGLQFGNVQKLPKVANFVLDNRNVFGGDILILIRQGDDVRCSYVTHMVAFDSRRFSLPCEAATSADYTISARWASSYPDVPATRIGH